MTDGSYEDQDTCCRPTTLTARTAASMTAGWSRTSHAKTTQTGCFSREATTGGRGVVVMGKGTGRRRRRRHVGARDATWSRNSRSTTSATTTRRSWRYRRRVPSCSAAAQRAVSLTNALVTLDVAVRSAPLDSTVNNSSSSMSLSPRHHWTLLWTRPVLPRCRCPVGTTGLYCEQGQFFHVTRTLPPWSDTSAE